MPTETEDKNAKSPYAAGGPFDPQPVMDRYGLEVLFPGLSWRGNGQGATAFAQITIPRGGTLTPVELGGIWVTDMRTSEGEWFETGGNVATLRLANAADAVIFGVSTSGLDDASQEKILRENLPRLRVALQEMGHACFEAFGPTEPTE